MIATLTQLGAFAASVRVMSLVNNNLRFTKWPHGGRICP